MPITQTTGESVLSGDSFAGLDLFWQQFSRVSWLAQHEAEGAARAFCLHLPQQFGQLPASATSRRRGERQLSAEGRWAYSGGSTSLALAQAHRSSADMQPQCRQHSSALQQPHGLSSHGKR